MRKSVLLSAAIVLLAVAGCQTTTDEDRPNVDVRSNANKAITDDPIKALQRY